MFSSQLTNFCHRNFAAYKFLRSLQKLSNKILSQERLKSTLNFWFSPNMTTLIQTQQQLFKQFFQLQAGRVAIILFTLTHEKIFKNIWMWEEHSGERNKQRSEQLLLLYI